MYTHTYIYIHTYTHIYIYMYAEPAELPLKMIDLLETKPSIGITIKLHLSCNPQFQSK